MTGIALRPLRGVEVVANDAGGRRPALDLGDQREMAAAERAAERGRLGRCCRRALQLRAASLELGEPGPGGFEDLREVFG
jgi:hypothetical protein